MEDLPDKLTQLNYYIDNCPSSIKGNADIIFSLRQELNRLGISREANITISYRIKSRVQKEANEALDRANGFGAWLMATRTGKSKAAVDKIVKVASNWREPHTKFIIAVPTERLRDNNWDMEFKKWGFMNYNDFVELTCYASLNKYRGGRYHVILDEAHNITELNSEFFEQNEILSCIAMTATRPNTKEKIEIFRRLKIFPVYEITADEAIRLGIMSNYEIIIVTVPLDETDKYVKSGNAVKGYFYTTEVEKYKFLSKGLFFSKNPMALINRMKFLSNLKSKTNATKAILEYVIPKDLRTLIFCGTKDQADILCPNRYYSQPTKPKKLSAKPTKLATEKFIEDTMKYNTRIRDYVGDKDLACFIDNTINRLSCVNALNEGITIEAKVDCALMAQIDSNPNNLAQRMGRTLMFNPDHTSKIIIVVSENTIDETWANKAAKNLDQSKIRKIRLEDLRTKKEQILFNN